VLATTSGLRVLVESADDGAGRLVRGAWHEIEMVKVEAKAGRLIIEWGTGAAPTVIPVEGRHRRLTSLLNERVAASTLAGRTLDVAGGQVRLALRRTPEGDVFSQVSAPSSVDLDYPETRRAIVAAERLLREAAALD
jgi:hypothetical protein